MLLPGSIAYGEVRPEVAVPRRTENCENAAITVVHMLKTVFANRPEVDIQDADI
jgi:hypothetical protein